MSLPTASAYLTAVQDPGSAFAEACLKQQRAKVGKAGIPLAWSGNFATIFRLEAPSRNPIALRCFTKPVEGLRERYEALSAFLQHCPADLSKHLLQTRFLDQGIKVEGKWHPVILMPWSSGVPLLDWVKQHLHQSHELRKLQIALGSMATAMERVGFVHGDLQHGNILVQEGTPVLVDYDNVLLPKHQNLPRTTDGIPAFRHPKATARTSVQTSDRFAVLVLHVALEALIQAPTLMKGRTEAEGLLFQGRDLADPERSQLFRELESHPRLGGLARVLKQVLAAPPEATPKLTKFLVGSQQLDAASREAAALKQSQIDLMNRIFALSRLKPAAVPEQTTGQARQLSVPLAEPPALRGKTPRSPRTYRFALGAALGAMLFFGLLPTLMGKSPATSGSLGPKGREWSQELRKELAQDLNQKKERLISLIVQIDESREHLNGVPDEVVLAHLEPGSDSAIQSTARALKADLTNTRTIARQSMLRCDEVLADFDQAIASSSSLDQLKERLRAIKDLPQVIRRQLG